MLTRMDDTDALVVIKLRLSGTDVLQSVNTLGDQCASAVHQSQCVLAHTQWNQLKGDNLPDKE